MKVLIKYEKNGTSKTQVTIEGHDLWDGDVTLAKVIYPFLKKYRNLYNGKNPMTGYPASFAPDPLKPEGPDNPDRFDEWLITLDKMVYSFGWIAREKDWDGPAAKSFSREYDELLKLHRKELKQLAKLDEQRFDVAEPNSALNSLEFDKRSEIMRPIYKKYEKLFDEHHLKIQEGIDLFAKHFGSLWT